MIQTTQAPLLSQRWTQIQQQLYPELREQYRSSSPKLEKLIHILEWTNLSRFLPYVGRVKGRPPLERLALASAFVAKSYLNITSTRCLIERLGVDLLLKRICGFSMTKALPSEATFSRAFSEFAQLGLAEKAHEQLIKEHLGEHIIGHISRDSTAISAREKVAIPSTKAIPARTVKEQRQQSHWQTLRDIPTHCDRGTKRNAKGYKESWRGYKLNIDTADCGVPVSAILSSASMHDSLAAVPLSRISAQRVTSLYDLMDAAYCSLDLHEHCRDLGHVPLIDHNPRLGDKEAFEPADKVRYRIRSSAERVNARLKDEFGARHIMVRGANKVYSHLMLGLLVLSVDQLIRLLVPD